MIRHIPLLLILAQLSILKAQEPAKPLSTDEARAINLLDSVQASDRYITALDSGSFFNMPIGIANNPQNTEYAILIDRVVIMPDRAEFSATMVLTNPFDGQKLVFQANDVPFSFSGGILGDFRLELVSEKPVSVCKDINLEILAGSYVECDCNGFKSLNIKGNVSLSDQVFVAATEMGQAIPGKKVTSFFETTITNWNDLTFTVSLPLFQLKAYSDFTFNAQNLSVDFSDLKNPSNLRFPSNYNSLYPPDMATLWRGIYIQNASILLNPEKFKRKTNPAPLVVGANNLLIDENGFTGEIYAENLLNLEQGSIAGWEFSIEHLGLEFETSELAGGNMAGQIHVPVFDDETNFNYDAFIDVEGNYGFTAGVDEELHFELFGKTEMDINRNSYLEIHSDENGFVPTMCLHGQMRINASINSESNDADDGNKVKVPTIDFQDFKVSTAEPYIDIAYMGYHSGTGQSKLAKFPLTITDIILQTTEREARLSIGAKVNLKESSDEGFSGSTIITLKAERDGYRYHYRGASINEIAVHVEKPGAYKINGVVGFANGDAIYGNGFKGIIQAEFGDGIKAEATALFGNKDNLRYFFVDAAFAMKPGIQAGPVTIFGFSGGLYYHMKRLTSGYTNQYAFGRTLSGMVYTPNASSGVGIMAGIKLGMGGEQIINGDLKFEIAFNNTGGLRFVGFNGLVECVTPPIEIDAEKFKADSEKLVEEDPGGLPPPLGSMMAARFDMYKDFENNEFHAEMEMYINVGGVLTGIGPNNRAGWAVAHSSPDEWYLHIGTPQEPIGLDLLGMAQLRAYFMAGHRIPTDIPMDRRVMDILHLSDADLQGNRNNLMISNGVGLAFGASFDISTGDKTFMLFYGSFELGAGFDLMLIDYGPNAYCAGSSPPLGINGWYAKGQAYAYFSGKIGLKAKVFGKEKKFEILSIAAAAILKAEGPNPVWLLGYVGGEYNVLNGMIKGNCRFKAEIGEKCDIQGATAASPLANLKMIGDITPQDEMEDVDVFSFPQVVFNVPVEKEQKISQSEGSDIKFRIKLKKLKLLDRNGADYPFNMDWNNKKDILVLQPTTMFYPEQDYSIEVEISFEELKNGTWTTFKDGGTALVETRTVTFKTGDLPTEIPEHIVKATYPVKKMFNFYPGEYNMAFMKLNQNIAPYFEYSENYERFAVWTTNGSDPIRREYNYNVSETTVYVEIPDNLKNDAVYSLNFVSSPKDKNNAVDRNVTSSTSSHLADDNSSMDITTQQATGTITSAEDKINYSIPFRVSMFNTLGDKLASKKVDIHYMHSVGTRKYYLVGNLNNHERFDRLEISGGLLEMISVNESDWFTDYINPHLYKRKADYGHGIIWRNESTCGNPPTKDIRIWQSYSDLALTDNEIETGIAINTTIPGFVVFTMPYYWSNDYNDIRNDIVSHCYNQGNSPSTIEKDILDHFYLRPPPPDEYYITFQYKIPGKPDYQTKKHKIRLNHTIKTDASDYE